MLRPLIVVLFILTMAVPSRADGVECETTRSVLHDSPLAYAETADAHCEGEGQLGEEHIEGTARERSLAVWVKGTPVFVHAVYGEQDVNWTGPQGQHAVQDWDYLYLYAEHGLGYLFVGASNDAFDGELPCQQTTRLDLIVNQYTLLGNHLHQHTYDELKRGDLDAIPCLPPFPAIP